MTKLLQSTSRGQVTLPKNWRMQFDTKYYIAEIKGESLIIKPVVKKGSFQDEVEKSWQEYRQGKFIDHKDLKKKYGL